MMRRAIGLMIGMGLIALVSGCGGSSDSSSSDASSGDSGAKAEVVKEANLICRRSAATREQKLAAAKGKPPTNDTAELERLVTQAYVPSLEAMIAELSALEAPAGDESEVEDIIQSFEQGIDKQKADPASALSEPAFEEADQLAKGYGWTECAKVG